LHCQKYQTTLQIVTKAVGIHSLCDLLQLPIAAWLSLGFAVFRLMTDDGGKGKKIITFFFSTNITVYYENPSGIVKNVINYN